jgi:hypothetical protein
MNGPLNPVHDSPIENHGSQPLKPAHRFPGNCKRVQYTDAILKKYVRYRLKIRFYKLSFNQVNH